MEDNFFTILWWLLPFIDMNHTRVHTCPRNLKPPPTSLPIPSLWVVPEHRSALSALLQALNLHWSSILHIVIDMFQCYSLKSSHPCLLPHSPKVCSLYLCLFCCLVYRVIVTIFLNSIYIGAVLRWRRNRTGRPLSLPQILQKNIWTLSKHHKTNSERWQRPSVTQKSSPLSSKGGRQKYKRQKERQKR